MASNESWEKIFEDYDIISHDFDKEPFHLSSSQIKKSCQDFKKVAQKIITGIPIEIEISKKDIDILF